MSDNMLASRLLGGFPEFFMSIDLGGSKETCGGGSELVWEQIEPWPEPVNGAVLLDTKVGLINRFVVMPKWTPETMSLWGVHTFSFKLRNVSTYIGIESPEKRCGKTTLLTVLSELVHRPEVASNISSPAFFRVIEETQPTLLIDEADTFLDGNEQLRGILNAGYTKKSAYVLRVAQVPSADKTGFTTKLVQFSLWCPKFIGKIGKLPPTLADRCILVWMERKMEGEPCERFQEVKEEGRELRRKCLRFVMDNAQAIASARPALPAGLNDRAKDIWEPLLVLADLAGGHWPETARKAAVHLSMTQDRSPIGALLLDLMILFIQNKTDRLLSRTIVEHLQYNCERPWAELSKGKQISEIWLAKQLSRYRVRSRVMRIGPERANGYYEADFKDVFKRYIPRAEFEALKAEWAAEKERTETEGGEGTNGDAA